MWVVGDFENQPGSVRVALRRADKPAIEAKGPIRGEGSLPLSAHIVGVLIFGTVGAIAAAIGILVAA